MTCRKMRLMLSVQRELTASERARVEEHLTGCPACHAVARQYELIDRRLGRLPQPVSATASPAAVQVRVITGERTMKSLALSRRRHVLQCAVLVAVVALIALAALVWRGPGPRQSPAPGSASGVAGTISMPTNPTSAAPVPSPDTGEPLIVQFGERVRLLDYDLELGAPPRLTLHWQALAEIDASYTIFVHLLDEDSRLWAQSDSIPGRGTLPTTGWVPGKIVTDEHEIAISADAPSGDYVIEIGMVQADTGQRLPVTDEDGHLLTEGLRLEGQFYWFSVRNDTGSRFAWPTFGYLSQTAWDDHPAVDIASLTGTPVCAAADGTVVQVDQDADYGIYVLLDHGDGYTTLYAHLDGAGVQVGDRVRQGRQIGVIGNTGKSTGPHLHFEIRRNGEPINPFAMMAEEEAEDEISSFATPETKTLNVLNVHGIQAHMLGQDAALSLEAMQELGFGWAKQQVQWKNYEPRDGDHQWDELDALVAAAKAADIRLLWSVVNAPEWSRSGQDLAGAGPPNDPQDLADFLGAIAERYCGSSVSAIEVWDEQNMPLRWGNMAIDPATYMRLLKPAYERIKAACPGMTVVSGALSPTSASSSQAMDDALYLEAMYQNGLKDYSDAIGIHLPTYNLPPDAQWEIYEDSSAHFRGPFQHRDSSWSFRSTAEEYRRVMEAHGDGARPVWVTQFGWAVADDPPQNYEYAADNTIQEQAEFTLQAFEMAREWGWVEAMFLWNLNFSVVAPDSAQAMWSIVGPGWERTFTFKMLTEMEK